MRDQPLDVLKATLRSALADLFLILLALSLAVSPTLSEEDVRRYHMRTQNEAWLSYLDTLASISCNRDASQRHDRDWRSNDVCAFRQIEADRKGLTMSRTQL